VLPERDGAEHGGAGTDHDVVADRRMPSPRLRPRATEGHPVVQQHVVTDDGGLTDHHAHAVVDEEPATDRGARVDLDAGEETRQLGDHTREQSQPGPPEAVREPVTPHGVQAGVGQPDLEAGAGGGIATTRVRDVLTDHQSARCSYSAVDR
jgi:hypothetical protein